MFNIVSITIWVSLLIVFGGVALFKFFEYLDAIERTKQERIVANVEMIRQAAKTIFKK